MSETKAMSDDAGVGPASREDVLRPVVRELARITETLQRLGSTAFLSTLGAVVSSGIGSILKRTWLAEPIQPQALFALCIIGLATFNIVLLVGYERLHKRGDILFDEISDELSVFSRTARKGLPTEIWRAMPPIEVRVALRSFTRNADLPLVPGRLSPAVYGLVNLLTVLLSLWGLVL